ncbi:Multidrug resistance protein MdtE [Methylobacterium adhaesivum]|uniref:Efflux RND transporter periplasmic adaptor subunit n=1 Tax=Methylobacterium adhaesivum TaxID=333297 RepID=A0ABT8BJK3_9HYPH|nr:efflux RND transporter periplasmic adaptor subunit [Methylobacterium adhaesivum]MDN3592352.1 efflux RND transporter periplasmic adaptor subunit [Methylobacterium adhaesivum]GJD31867.1 Multidrug resistance protein MdtE [Methylobacterium adhaesivum]
MIRRSCLAVAAALALGACKPEEEAGPTPVRPVLTVTAKPVATEMFGPFAGFVAPRYQSEIGFQIAGRMVARDVTMGDVVTKGQRLAALDPVVPRFALTRAEADLADAEAQAENASATESRRRRLMAGGNVAQAQLDSAVASRDTAQARLAQAQASLQKARDQMGYTELHADFDGVVTVRSAEVGQVLSAGQAVLTLARPEEREAVVDIPEDLVAAMPKDAEFTVALQSAPDVTATARVREIAPFADRVTRTRRIRMTLLAPSPAFRLGSTLTVSLSRPVPPRFVLPATAILKEGGRDAVWLVDAAGKTVTRRAVTVAQGDAALAAVTDGLNAGDRVVVAGIHSLSEGQAVRLPDATP